VRCAAEPACSERLAAQLKDAELAVLRGGAHLVMQEQPKAVSVAVDAFFRRIGWAM
jgi:pimeloyl-ACP methyl ester carboxylesterase